MPAPIPVRLVEHDPEWPKRAMQEILRLREVLGPRHFQVEHIGSTAIPGILAKPTLDLLGVVRALDELDDARTNFEEAGYEWHGEFGFAGRRYLTRTSPVSGERVVNLHCYAAGDPAIVRHLAFRNHLRANPKLAADYQQIKERCAELHPGDSHAYTACKNAWIKRVESEALAARGNG